MKTKHILFLHSEASLSRARVNALLKKGQPKKVNKALMRLTKAVANLERVVNNHVLKSK